MSSNVENEAVNDGESSENIQTSEMTPEQNEEAFSKDEVSQDVAKEGI